MSHLRALAAFGLHCVREWLPWGRARPGRVYETFDLLITRAGAAEAGYCARLLEAPVGAGKQDFTLSLSPEEVALLRRRIPRPSPALRRVESSEMELIKQVGGRLFKEVFSDKLLVHLNASLAAVSAQGKGLCLRLRLTEVPELAELPWEYLYDEEKDVFLASDPAASVAVVRALEIPTPPRAVPPTGPPLRILVVIANPLNLRRLDAEQEWSRIQEALAGLERPGLARVDRLENATISALLEKVSKGKYHVIHFIGHGEFDEKRQAGVLLLEDRRRRSRRIYGRKLGTLLTRTTVRLAVLNVCEGARSAREDPFAGLAQTLVRQGVPAVVAMQFEVADSAAASFAHRFYQGVARGLSVEEAVAEARVGLFVAGGDVEWGTPVLFTRTETGPIVGPPPRWLCALFLAVPLLLASLGATLGYQYLDEQEPPQRTEKSLSEPRQWPPWPDSHPDCPSPDGFELSFVRIEPGHFTMGADRGPKEDKPAHQVTLTRPFCLARFEVTQEIWRAVLGEHETPSAQQGQDLPVESVEWNAVQRFLDKLNELVDGDPFRLPTEAEWEYAARAGSTSIYSFGDDPDGLYLYGNCLGGKEWDDGWDNRTAPVGSYQPNAWGLYDMHGNAWEWVADFYARYSAEPAVDPRGATGKERVRRGGAYDSRAERCRSSSRDSSLPYRRFKNLGFRIARDPLSSSAAAGKNSSGSLSQR